MSINRQDFNELVNERNSPCVSIYMPTFRSGPDRKQNEIRIKNLVKDAEELLAKDAPSGEPDEQSRQILGPLHQLRDDEDHDLWRHPGRGLAIFANSDSFRAFQLPVVVDEQVHCGDRFYLRPLLPLLQANGQFVILSVSQNAARLFEASESSVDEIHPESLPQGLVDALNVDEFISSLQYFSYQVRNSDPAMFHGQGGGEDDHKKLLLQYFHRLDDALSEYLSGRDEPLVFAGVEYLFPIFKEAVGYPKIIPEPACGNFDDAPAEKLLEQAWEVVNPHFQRELDEAVADFQQAHGQDRASSDLESVLRAATMGAVDKLLVKKGAACWGDLDVDGNVEIHEERRETSIDLVDEAAFETLKNNGRVFILEDRFPDEAGLIASVLRHPLPQTAS